MKKYYNSKTNSWYIEGRSITIMTDKGLFSGVPNEEQLEAWGYKEHIEPTPEPLSEEQIAYNERLQRMNEIQSELTRTDYIAIKAFEGYDVSEYEDWKGIRNALREEYNELEVEVNKYLESLNDNQTEEEL